MPIESSSSSSSSLGIFDNVWPYPRFDAQGTAKTNLEKSGYDLKFIVPLIDISDLPGSTHYNIVTPLLVEYSETLDHEVIYALGFNSSSNKLKLFAFKPDGSLMWITANLILSATNDTFINATIMSANTKKYIFCTLNYFNLGKALSACWSIRLENGSFNWRIDPWRDNGFTSNGSVAGTIMDNNGYIYFGEHSYAVGNVRLFSLIYSADTGLIINVNTAYSVLLMNDIPKMYPYFVSNISKTAFYCCGLYGDTATNIQKTRILQILSSGNPPVGAPTAIPVLINGSVEGNINCNGLAHYSNSLYMTSNYGLFKFDLTFGSEQQLWHRNQALINPTEPTIATDGTIYYSDVDTVYAVTDLGATWSSKWEKSGFKPSYTNNVSIIIEQDDNLIVTSNNSSGNNFTVLVDSGTSGTIVENRPLFNVSTRYISRTPALGPNIEGNINWYIPYNDTALTDLSYVYILFDSEHSSSSSESSQSAISSSSLSSSSLTSQSESLSSQSEIVTTTTTTLSPISTVQTSAYTILGYTVSNHQVVLAQTSNASDNIGNRNTPLAKAFTFGTIAPKEISRTVIIALNVPNTRAIANIQLALISTGGIPFSNSIFGYTTSVELRDDITPDSYFQGINSDISKTSIYNIPVKNRDNFNSEYVYLNVNLPIYNPIGSGMCRYCWLFDFAS